MIVTPALNCSRVHLSILNTYLWSYSLKGSWHGWNYIFLCIFCCISWLVKIKEVEGSRLVVLLLLLCCHGAVGVGLHRHRCQGRLNHLPVIPPRWPRARSHAPRPSSTPPRSLLGRVQAVTYWGQSEVLIVVLLCALWCSVEGQGALALLKSIHNSFPDGLKIFIIPP